MPLQRRFRDTRAISGNLVSTWTALELNNPENDIGNHRREAEPYHTEGFVERHWTGQNDRWLVLESHAIYHLQGGEGDFHVWKSSWHVLPPPTFTYSAIAEAVMPENMSPEEWLRSSGFRDPARMYEVLGHPTAVARLGQEFVDVMYQILDRIMGAMAELHNEEYMRGEH